MSISSIMKVREEVLGMGYFDGQFLDELCTDLGNGGKCINTAMKIYRKTGNFQCSYEEACAIAKKLILVIRPDLQNIDHLCSNFLPVAIRLKLHGKLKVWWLDNESPVILHDCFEY